MPKKKLHIHIPTVVVPVPHPDHADNGFELRGLNLTDLSTLMAKHAPNIAKLYNEYVAKDGFDINDPESKGEFAKIVKDLPELFGDFIETLTDGEVGAKVALKLPMTVQLESLTKAAEVTFQGENSLEKLLTVASKMFTDIAEGVKNTQLATQTPSKSGTKLTA